MQSAAKTDWQALDHGGASSPNDRFVSIMNIVRQRTARFYLVCGSVFLFLIILFSGHRHVAGVHPYATYSRDHEVTNTTFGFEKILVVSMASRHDKRDAMSLSASVSGVDFEWVDGVDGASVTAKARPPKMTKMLERDNGTLGCWRAHMNALQHIVKESIQTALIMEDDADWDVNVKQQLMHFAQGAKYVQSSQDNASQSPYGSDWEMLWLGHCGVKDGPRENRRVYVTRDDPTAIPPELFEFHARVPDLHHAALDANFTRVIMQVKSGLCANAYAVTLKGAQMILNQESQIGHVADIALSDICGDTAGARCIAPWPSIFNPYRAPGPMSKDSDRQDFAAQWRETGLTHHVVFPTRMNMDALVGMGGAARVIKSQWPGKTILQEYEGELQIPSGKGIQINEQDYYDLA